MTEDADHEVRKILVLPQENVDEHIHESAVEQLAVFSTYIEAKISDYKEVLNQNLFAVFAVNYVQNRFISTEFTLHIARLWKAMEVYTVAEFSKALESMKGDPESVPVVELFERQKSRLNELLKQIDTELDAKIGPNITSDTPSEELNEMGIHSRTITHYVQGSPFDLVLVVIVRTFSNPDVSQHILALYNKMQDFHRMGCDVFILTRGPPIGSRGGSYLKLIGVPFRKLYDETEAVEELKAHRKSALQLAGWDALVKMVEVSLVDETRQGLGCEGGEKSDDQAAYISQKGGTILVNRSGKILYKFVESEGCTWPNVETVINEVTKATALGVKTQPGSKVQSEISIQQRESTDPAKTDEKKCCTIL